MSFSFCHRQTIKRERERERGQEEEEEEEDETAATEK